MTTLQDIFSQDAAVETILRACEADRLPHGLIFAGPVGVGKATAARGLAALFLCENPKKDQPCGKCKSCTLMEAGTHPDFFRVYRQLIRLTKEESKTKDLPIDVIRQYVIAPASHTSQMKRGRVFVVAEAHLMNKHAQDALLKTLEEPAGTVLIIFLTDQPDDLTATIRSRCQLVRFAPLEAKLVQRELEKRKIDKSLAAEAA